MDESRLLITSSTEDTRRVMNWSVLLWECDSWKSCPKGRDFSRGHTGCAGNAKHRGLYRSCKAFGVSAFWLFVAPCSLPGAPLQECTRVTSVKDGWHSANVDHPLCEWSRRLLLVVCEKITPWSEVWQPDGAKLKMLSSCQRAQQRTPCSAWPWRSPPL